jgi:inosine triphosphate pyrophosphatase
MTTYLITGNLGKLRELQTVLPAELQLEHKELDLDEIQSLDPREIVAHKVREAYKAVGAPCIVEDVSAELASLNGLPGPFIKFFMKKLGNDALYKIGAPNDHLTVRCTMAYYDGENEIVSEGIMEATIVAPCNPELISESFGFDMTVLPDGYDKTVYELGVEIKNQISHRAHAAKSLAAALSERNLIK